MPSLAYDVCALGNAIVDITADVADEFLRLNQIPKDTMIPVDRERITFLRKSLAAARTVRAGGAAGNMVAGIASFGGKAAYLGKIARDEVGHLFSGDLQKLGIDFPTTPVKHEDAATGLCLSFITMGGHRSMCTYLGANSEFGPYDVHAPSIQAAKITFIEGYLFDRANSKLALHLAADLARAAGHKVALALCDFSCVDRNRADFIELVCTKTDILFANEHELTTLYKTSSLDAAMNEAKAHVGIAAITRSEKGSVILQGGKAVTVPAETITRVVDKTGAGDAYAAGFLFGHARGLELERCARLGSLAGAEVIAHYGPRPEHSLAARAKQKGLLN